MVAGGLSIDAERSPEMEAFVPDSAGRLEAAAAELCALLRAYCDARAILAAADRSTPYVSVATL